MEFLGTVAEMAGIYFTTAARWVFMILAVFILVRQIRSLLRAKNPSEIWAYLGCPDGSSVPLTHWENLMGRGRGCDIILNLNSVSRSHGTLIRDSAGVWKYNDLSSKNGSAVNGIKVKEPTEIKAGDILTIGGSDFTLYPVSLQERMDNIAKRKSKTHPVSPWPSLLALTIFQFLTVLQFKVSLGENFPASLTAAFALLCVLMWAYVIVLRMFKRVGFEMEMIAFFLSTLSLSVTATAYPDTVFKQAICVCLGVGLFFGLCWYLRDLNRAKKIVYILVGASVVLLIANLLFGTIKNGSQNWMEIGGFSFQPSELVKIVFIYIGAATLDELQQRRNLTVFMLFSVFCLGCLAIMGDFGTAIIFFVTFLIISFLRSGDFSKLILVVGAAGLMGMMILRFKPYIADRFDTWGHVWEDPTGDGFQQVQAMTSAASGGLPGLGAGEGNFSDVAAANTDFVFALLSEEWGLLIAVLAVLCIITLGVFAVRSIIAGRSTYYSIAACSATSMFIFQTILNVFGSVDLLPLTGVTFPFTSAGGTSMITSWGLLAFLKAADTRQNASFAIRLDKKHEFDDELSGGGLENPEDIFREDNGYYADDHYDDYRRPRPHSARKLSDDEYTYHSNRDTMVVKPSTRKAPTERRPIEYEEFSDDDFFENLEHSRPGSPDTTGDAFLDKLMQGPTDETGRKRRPAGNSGSSSSRGPAGSSGSSRRPSSSRGSSNTSGRHSAGSSPGNANTRRPADSGSSRRPASSRGSSNASGRHPAGSSLGNTNTRRPADSGSSRRPSSSRGLEDDDRPLTLDDIFGGDKK